MVKDWMGISELLPSQWEELSFLEWWKSMSDGASKNRKAMASLTLLVSWKIWSERNARVFHNTNMPPLK
jgi:hypothetical protein